jgi:hypothetical protein
MNADERVESIKRPFIAVVTLGLVVGFFPYENLIENES